MSVEPVKNKIISEGDKLKVYQKFETASAALKELSHNVIWRYESTVETNKEHLRKIKHLLSVAENLMNP